MYETICDVARYVCSEAGQAVLLVEYGETGCFVVLMRWATGWRCEEDEMSRWVDGMKGCGSSRESRRDRVGCLLGGQHVVQSDHHIIGGRSRSPVDAHRDDTRLGGGRRGQTGGCSNDRRARHCASTATEARDGDSAPQDALHGFTLPRSRLTRELAVQSR
jgi:hypothetical protein